MASETKEDRKSSKKAYDHKAIELKWQSKWEKDKVYQPDLNSAKDSRPPHFAKASRGKPFYNLMMFPYPSAEGLHVGSVYSFGGADVYGRFKRMQGYDVFEPIGLDGFGIHSENHAIKTNTHPIDHAKRTEENFYRQLHSFGNSFAWDSKLETYDPRYYRWTQWLFVQLFKSNLAYRKKSPVNYCPVCKTVLADEQVIEGKCERCNSIVEKRELEQWYFRITNYAQRLLSNIKDLNWTEKVKIAQTNWIGRSEGATIEFPLVDKGVKHFVLLHGKGGSSRSDFHQWLKAHLEGQGYTVEVPDLPNSGEPNDDEQAEYVMKRCRFDEHTAVVGHSFGGIVALRLLERGVKLAKVVLVSTPYTDNFLDGRERPTVSAAVKKGFDFEMIKKNCGGFVALYDTHDHVVSMYDGESFAEALGCLLRRVKAEKSHFNGEKEFEVLAASTPTISAFTTRPDTLHGVTYMVLAPEHLLVDEILSGVIPADAGIQEREAKRMDSWSAPTPVKQAASFVRPRNDIEKYVNEARAKSDIERQAEGKEKTGVFSGLYAINPVNGEEIPVWIADYVLGGYGTGVIMAVPAHDQRDWEFAKKFGLKIKTVIAIRQPAEKQSHAEGIAASPMAPRNDDSAYTGPGILVNSGEWDGLKVPAEMGKVLDWLEEKGIGKREVNYHLRDWLISRQRYWGPPIPMIFCEKCAKEGITYSSTKAEGRVEKQFGPELTAKGFSTSSNNNYVSMAGWFPVPEDQLPVELPYIENHKPMGTGKSPLASDPDFVNVKCPHCGANARRETDVSDTFLDSAWYFLRYLATDWEDVPFPSRKWEVGGGKLDDGVGSDKSNLQPQSEAIPASHIKPLTSSIDRRLQFLPVTMYIGGAEHSVLHLLYARFITMFLHDLGYLDFEEPFSRFYAHGLIIKDGAKMSKSKGNVINPDEYIAKYGADTLRCYLMFLGPFNQGGDFRDSGIEGMSKFLRRVWNLLSEKSQNNAEREAQNQAERSDSVVRREVSLSSAALRMMHKTIKKVTEELEHLRYNTAIAALMEYYNFLAKQESISREEVEVYLKLLAPFAPYMTEELFQALNYAEQDAEQRGKDWSIHLQEWPSYDEKYLVAETLTVAIQVNGKLRGTVEIPAEEAQNKEMVEKLAREQEGIVKFLTNNVRQLVYVPGKVLNFVAEG